MKHETSEANWDDIIRLNLDPTAARKQQSDSRTALVLTRLYVQRNRAGGNSAHISRWWLALFQNTFTGNKCGQHSPYNAVFHMTTITGFQEGSAITFILLQNVTVPLLN